MRRLYICVFIGLFSMILAEEFQRQKEEMGKQISSEEFDALNQQLGTTDTTDTTEKKVRSMCVPWVRRNCKSKKTV